MKRRLLTLLMAFCLVVTMMPAMTSSAFAETVFNSVSAGIEAVAGEKISQTKLWNSNNDYRLSLDGVYYQSGSNWVKNTDASAVYVAGNTYRVDIIFSADDGDRFRGGYQASTYFFSCSADIELNGQKYKTLNGTNSKGAPERGQDNNLVMECIGGQQNKMLVRVFITIPEASKPTKPSGTEVSSVAINPTEHTMTVGETYKLSAKASPVTAINRTIFWKSMDTDIASVSTNGTVTAKKEGTTSVLAIATGSGKFASCKITVVPKQEQPTTPTTPEQPTTPTTPTTPEQPTTPTTPTTPGTGIINPGTGTAVDSKFNGFDIKPDYASIAYNGDDREPGVSIKDAAGNKLIEDVDYTIEYFNNRTVGKATVIVKGMGKYAGVTAGVNFTIKPKAVTVKSLKKPAAKKLTVKWGSHKAQTTGFQVRYSTSKSFKSGTYKTVTIKSKSATSKTLTKLKQGKKYYVKVRAYKTVDGKKIYSSWSKVKYAKA